MITPRFSCSQSEDAVIVTMYCPSVRASDVEISVDDTLFSIHVNPYFLRLNFPHPLRGDEDASASYDAGTGYLTVSLNKETKGQDFKDLDLLAKLLAPRPAEQIPEEPGIEVLASEDAHRDDDSELAERAQQLTLEQREILEAANNDWQLPQETPEPLPPLRTTPEHRYGFLDMHIGYFRHVAHAENEVNELGPDAETMPPAERRKRRLIHEQEKWDDEYYMADFVDDEYIQELLAWASPVAGTTDGHHFTEEENATMLRLPRKEYSTIPQQTHDLYLTLLTLLFSYAYETRTTQQDPTPESAWTLASLTPAFSALDPAPYHALPERSNPASFTETELSATFVASYRRALAFPLFRSFALAERCRADVVDILAGGRRLVTRCLLGMKHVLDHHEVYYVYSKVWVDDYCVWTLAYTRHALFPSLSRKIAGLKIAKSMVGWDLDELESAALEETERQSDSDDESEDEIEQMLPAPL
ncbi:hypothetical protein POSPLADRAFT_1135835 [Postia placenta MAD-698-R-SB12]|uniref:CS domain-containing protein n=1 Tax=Postia placenta MAD-698-R-SB12 TaxID=670580 RepID=A0A1X6N8G0_9APHY|nr:hypothetical protein POSPLADRAFT_1135835 [Postia placenta MAD-698-R-SB12]OSX64918.1 hypothetical protein POSPLADRAFT_1135835 [Postia placenta MAD-698-R-SB12]